MSRTPRLTLGLLGVALGATLMGPPAAQASPDAPSASTAAASSANTTLTRRATVRDHPGRLVLANAVAGDVVTVQGTCGSWARVKVARRVDDHAMATDTGWIERAALRRDLTVADACGRRTADADRWKDWVRAINSPFRSVRLAQGSWQRVTYGTRVDLDPAPQCAPSLNYVRNPGLGDDTADPSQLVADVDYDRISYRYQNTDGGFALVNVGRIGTTNHAWSFVPTVCLRSRNGAPFAFPTVARLDDLSDYPEAGIRSAASLRRRGCSGGVRADAQFGWLPEADPGQRPGCPV